MRRLAVPLLLVLAILGLPGSARAGDRSARPDAAHRVRRPPPPLPVLTPTSLRRRLAAARRAHRKVVVHFWATWCPPCLKELPRVVEAVPGWRRHAEVILLAVVRAKDAALARKLVGPGPGRYRLDAKDPSTVTALFDRAWNGGLPATFVLDGHGKVVYRVIGPFDRRAVDRALGIP